MPAPDTRQPIFDPGMDVATVVFSHVQCVKTRVNLAVVSKLWRDASKPAAAYPLEFEFAAGSSTWHRGPYVWDLEDVLELMDNDEALSLPYERVVGLFGETLYYAFEHAAVRGSVRLLKWMRENDWSGADWSADICKYAAGNGHLPALKYLHENGCPWDEWTCCYAAANGHLFVLKYSHENGCPWDKYTCIEAAENKRWDCLQYAVDNKCPQWDDYAKIYAEHLR